MERAKTSSDGWYQGDYDSWLWGKIKTLQGFCGILYGLRAARARTERPPRPTNWPAAEHQALSRTMEWRSHARIARAHAHLYCYHTLLHCYLERRGPSYIHTMKKVARRSRGRSIETHSVAKWREWTTVPMLRLRYFFLSRGLLTVNATLRETFGQIRGETRFPKSHWTGRRRESFFTQNHKFRMLVFLT